MNKHIERKNAGLEGSVIEVLINEKGNIGRDAFYRPVIVRSKRNMLDNFVKAKVVKAEKFYLKCKLY